MSRETSHGIKPMSKILILTTSHSKMGDTDHRTGSWVEEVAAPYYIMSDAGIAVTIASIAGGVVPFDPNSQKPDAVNNDHSKRFIADAIVQAALQKTPALADLNPEDFDGIFIPGGHGVMWDLPGNNNLAAWLKQYESDGKIIAAVCHGPAGLLGATRADGKPLVAGRNVTGFTNAEEEAVGLSRVVPFMLESRMRELGGVFTSGGDWQAYAVRDGHLITGQNPMSSELVGEHIVTALDE
jgi:putative intracellular protease/amidase